MGIEKRTWWMVQILLFYSLLLHLVGATPLVPCMFVFGDSLFDNGNNNFRKTMAKGNYLPYGIDFQGGPSGRFSNGRTQADVVSELLGFDHYIPPFAATFGPEILDGVNFASAGSGIRDDSGTRTLGQIIPLNEQISNFKTITSRMAVILGEESAAERLNKCIYLIEAGIDDFIGNYFVNSTGTSKNYTLNQFADVLIAQFTQQLWTLYGNGARKLVIYGLGQGGCAPIGLATSSKNGIMCPKGYDAPLKYYNGKLKKVVQNINLNSDAKAILVDVKGIFNDILDNPSHFGFKVINFACCGAGKNNAETLCPRFQTPCPNRTEFVFWDSFHPTEAANVLVSNRAFHAQKLTDSYPFDIFHLAQL